MTIEVFPFADLSDNSDGGNGFGYYEVHIGGTQITSSVSGVVSGAPADGKFRRTNGSHPTICCFHVGNKATITVTDAFFNSRIGAAGAASDELLIHIRIPSGSNVPCAAVANDCANMDDGFQRAEVTWTPAIPCDPPDCDDGDSCTDDVCNPGTGICEHSNVAAVLTGICYGCDDSLTRTQDHVLRLTFACDITLPGEGQPVEIRELEDSGAFGSTDFSDSFTYTIESGNVLRLEETGCVLGDCTGELDTPWYAVMNTGSWAGVADFQVDYVVVRGDANNTLFTNFADLGFIFENIVNPAADDDRSDINASGFVNFADLGAANAFIGSNALDTKPDGHGCFPLPLDVCAGSGESAMPPGGGEYPSPSADIVSTSAAAGEFINGFVSYLGMATVPVGTENDFKQLVGQIVEWTVAHLSENQRKTLADKLQDPSLAPASAIVAKMIPDIATALLE